MKKQKWQAVVLFYAAMVSITACVDNTQELQLVFPLGASLSDIIIDEQIASKKAPSEYISEEVFIKELSEFFEPNGKDYKRLYKEDNINPIKDLKGTTAMKISRYVKNGVEYERILLFFKNDKLVQVSAYVKNEKDANLVSAQFKQLTMNYGAPTSKIFNQTFVTTHINIADTIIVKDSINQYHKGKVFFEMSSNKEFPHYTYYTEKSFPLFGIKHEVKNTARLNVESFFEQKISNVYSNSIKIIDFKHSNLYIYIPLDSSKIPVPVIPDSNDKEKKLEHFVNEFSDRSVGFTLAVDGCNQHAIETIVKRDKVFREWMTGGNEYIMTTFITVFNEQFNSTDELGLCFRLDSLFNIDEVYSISEDDEDFVYIRTIGYSEERILGAINCDYEYRARVYDYTVEKMQKYLSKRKKDEHDRASAYVDIKTLNGIFGYERFYTLDMKNRDEAVKQCLKRLNQYTDKKELRKKASETIWSFIEENNVKIKEED